MSQCKLEEMLATFSYKFSHLFLSISPTAYSGQQSYGGYVASNFLFVISRIERQLLMFVRNVFFVLAGMGKQHRLVQHPHPPVMVRQ